MKVIGLTGRIGSGKSTVSQYLAELGAVIIDADKVAHEALSPDNEIGRNVITEFGQDILTPDGKIDRQELGEIVFNNPEALSRLTKIMHPPMYNMVKAKLEEYERQGVDEVVLEAPLLIEADWTPLVHEVWVTVAPEATVLRRIKEKNGLPEQETRKRIHAQLSNEDRTKHAHVVIDTDCSLDELKNRVLGVWMRNKTRFASFDLP